MKVLVILMALCITCPVGAETLKEWRARRDVACPQKFVEMSSEVKKRRECEEKFENEYSRPYDRVQAAAELEGMKEEIRSQKSEMQQQQAEMQQQQAEMQRQQAEMQRMKQQQQQQRINNMF